MTDVAREAGVSKQTVSRILSGKGEASPPTIERVHEVVSRLGYRPSSLARSLATNRTLTLGLIVPNLSNPYFAELAEAVEITAWENSYNTFLCNIFRDPEREEAALQALEDRQVDGVIICSTRLVDKKLFPLLAGYQAAVLVNRPAPGDVAGTIMIDDARGSALAVAHLLRAQRRVLGLLAGPPNSVSGRARLRGFVAALEAAGYPVDRDLIVPCRADIEAGYEAARGLLGRHPEVNGLVCFNDIVAIGALRACRTLGLEVPDDVAVIGHDDIPMAELVTPALTTLRVSKYDLGANAVRMLLDRLQARNRQTEIVLKPELVVRESTP